jgi:hypothetical protein
VQTFLLFVRGYAQFGVLNWGCVVKCGVRLFCLNENSALACSPWIDETVGFHTSAVLTLSLTECLSVVILSVV